MIYVLTVTWFKSYVFTRLCTSYTDVERINKTEICVLGRIESCQVCVKSSLISKLKACNPGFKDLKK